MNPIRIATFALAVASLGGALHAQTVAFVDPPRFDFGEVQVLSSGRVDVVTVLDADAMGDQNVRFVSNNPAFRVEPAGALLLVPGQGADIEVVFTPPNPGEYTGAIVAERVGDGMVLGTMPVEGTGVGPITVDPTSLLFEPQLIGTTSAPQSIRVTADSMRTAPLEVNIITSRDEFQPAVEFLLLQPGASATVPVTFTPTQAAPVRGVIGFEVGILGGVTTGAFVEVEGSGLAITAAPNPLLMPDTLIGCDSTATLLVTPAGIADVLAGSTNQGVFTVTPRTFIARTPTELTVRANGIPGEGRRAEIVLTAREDGLPVQQERIPVSVNALALAATPTLLDFGTVPVGADPAVRSIMVSTDPMGMVEFEVSALSDSVDFIVDSIEGNQVNIRFGPQAAGQFSGVISITAAPAQDPMCVREVRIPVSGQAGADQITLDPPVLAFGPVGIGGEATRSVTLANASRNVFTGTVDIDSDVFSIGPGVGQTAFNLPAGGSTTFDVTFRPRTLAAVSAEAQFLLTSGNGSLNLTRTLPITGQGSDVELRYEVITQDQTTPLLPGGTFAAPRTPVGAASVFDIRVVNDGGAPVLINNATLSGMGFTILESPGFPTTLAAGGTLPIVYEFRPSGIGTTTATIGIDDAIFNLSGIGTSAGGQITGVVPALGPASQLDVGIRLDQFVDRDVTGVLELDYQPRGGLPPDPAVQFATGSTAPFTIAAGSTTADFGGAETVGLQTGTVAADLNLTATLDANGADVTPVTGLLTSGAIEEAAPTIVSVAFDAVSPTGFTIVVTGYSPTRQVNSATFNFRARSGVQLTNPSVSPTTIGGEFATWFGGSTEFGGLFTLRMPFTISGEQNAIDGVTVTLQNDAGTSAGVTASR